MTVAPGTKLGPYEILSPLGAGGMGEVYRARDTRLGRDVAVKVLPQHLSSNSEVRARFEREAKTVSSLNHPHICVLHDVGREGDTDYLVMELVDGETLAARLLRGPLPAADVLKIGAQIADALERAHRAGVVHRDLKPGNVMLTKSGTKLMDFGLARGTGMAAATGSGASLLTQSPTIAQPLTTEGTIIGTFQYMAPEQLEGRETDARSDIWALGCVLYEMATGVRAFEGKSQASLIATIMHTDPRPLRELAPASPQALDRLIGECLAKDPEERRQSAGDVRRELNRIARGDVEAAVAPTPARASAAKWIAVAVGVGAIAAIAGFITGRGGEEKPAAAHIAFNVPAPTGSRFRFTIEEDGTRLAPPVISPDGTEIVFGVVDSKGRRVLMRRSLRATEVSPVPGSVDARIPFWSPDGQHIGFFAEGKMRRVPLVGGSAVTVVDGVGNPRGASWSRKGTIVYAPTANSAILAVPETGGTPVQVTFPDTTLPDISHRFPVFLPDGDHFLFLVWTNNPAVRDSIGGLYMTSLRSRDVKRITPSVSNAVYLNGSLVLARDGTLFHASFDPSSGELGNWVPTDQRVGWDSSTGLALFDIATNGTLLCRETGDLVQTRLVWFDRVGAPLDTVTAAGNFRQIAVARAGGSGAVSMGNAVGDGDIWLLDFARGLTSRYTNSPADEEDPMLSADGRRIAYASDVDGPYHVFTAPADRSGAPERISPRSDDWNMLDWSADGRLILLASATDLWVLDVATREGHKWHSVPGSSSPSSAGCFSPDNKWIAYGSSDSGRDEIYVRPYPGPGGQWQVSIGGGFRPHWSNDGREIIYAGLDGDLMAVAVDTRDGFRTAAPRRLFRAGARMAWAATGDHARFLVGVRAPGVTDPPLKVITGWFDVAR